jgi:hypothetical protein
MCKPTKPGPLWGKKDKHCDPHDPADRQQGSQWDHVLLDVESRLVVSLVVGPRTTETLRQAFTDFYRRTDGGLPALITTDEYVAYFTVIVSTWGVRKEDLEMTEAEKKRYGWDEMPAVYFPVEIAYATVCKEREQGRVVRVNQRVVFGTPEQVVAALEAGSTAKTINTSYIERWNGTQRHFNARKARKVYTFSKDFGLHVAVTWLVVTFYNFCWTPRTLREQVQLDPPRYHYRTPAMVAGLVAKVWTLEEILRQPLFGRPLNEKKRKSRRRKAVKVDGG